MAPARLAGPEAEREALRIARRYVETFTARDLAAWRDALNFPHVRVVASGQVVTWRILSSRNTDRTGA